MGFFKGKRGHLSTTEVSPKGIENPLSWSSQPFFLLARGQVALVWGWPCTLMPSAIVMALLFILYLLKSNGTFHHECLCISCHHIAPKHYLLNVVFINILPTWLFIYGMWSAQLEGKTAIPVVLTQFK